MSVSTIGQADQSISYASYFGGNDFDGPEAVDINSEYYCIAGYTLSTSNIATPGAHQISKSGEDDGFIALFDSNDQLLWSTYFGGDGVDWISDVALFDDGIVVCGYSTSSSNISTNGSYQEENGGVNNTMDGILARFSMDGILEWATYFGGPESDRLVAVDVDNNGDIIVNGYTLSDSLSTPGAYQPEINGGADINGVRLDGIIAKFTETGEVLWSTYYGGAGIDRQSLVTVNDDNEIVVGGTSNSENGISTPGSYQPELIGNSDATLSRFSSEGNLLEATYYGIPGGKTSLSDLSLADDGTIFISGNTTGPGLATSGAFQEEFAGGVDDNFVARFNGITDLNWCSYWGGFDSGITGEFDCYISLSDNRLYIAKFTPLDGFSLGDPLKASPDLSDWLVGSLTLEGGLNWATYLGGDLHDFIEDIESMGNNQVMLIGGMRGFDSYITHEAYQSELNSNSEDGAIVKLRDETISGLEGQESIDFSLYPNPANSSVRVIVPDKYRKAQATLYDISGRAVARYTINNAFSTLPLNVASGVYTIKMESGDGVGAKKIVVK